MPSCFSSHPGPVGEHLSPQKMIPPPPVFTNLCTSASSASFPFSSYFLFWLLSKLFLPLATCLLPLLPYILSHEHWFPSLLHLPPFFSPKSWAQWIPSCSHTCSEQEIPLSTRWCGERRQSPVDTSPVQWVWGWCGEGQSRLQPVPDTVSPGKPRKAPVLSHSEVEEFQIVKNIRSQDHSSLIPPAQHLTVGSLNLQWSDVHFMRLPQTLNTWPVTSCALNKRVNPGFWTHPLLCKTRDLQPTHSPIPIRIFA